MKKSPGDIIILHLCITNDDHMMHGSWDMEYDRQNLPLYPTNNPKLWNNKKRPGNIINLHKCTKNHDHMLYCLWDMACDGCNFVIFFKKEKNPGDIIILHVYQKLWSDEVQFLRYGAQRTDGWTDGWMEKWHIAVGATPKKYWWKNPYGFSWNNKTGVFIFYYYVVFQKDSNF